MGKDRMLGSGPLWGQAATGTGVLGLVGAAAELCMGWVGAAGRWAGGLGAAGVRRGTARVKGV